MAHFPEKQNKDGNEQEIDRDRQQRSLGVISRISSVDLNKAVIRYREGDWGDLSEEDQFMNARASSVEGFVLGEYESQEGVRFWIISEPDTGVTKILLPEEYLGSR